MTAILKRTWPVARRRRWRRPVTVIRRWDRRSRLWQRFLLHWLETPNRRSLRALARAASKSTAPTSNKAGRRRLGPLLPAPAPVRPETVLLAPGGGVRGVVTSRTTWDVASKLNRALAPVGVAIDAARLGLAVKKDRGLGRHSARTGASIAGGWAGGYAGGVAGSQTGAVLGAVAGPVGVLLGGLTGGLVGAVAGAVGLSKLSEKGVDSVTRVADARRGRVLRLPVPVRKARAPVRFSNDLRRGRFRPTGPLRLRR